MPRYRTYQLGDGSFAIQIKGWFFWSFLEFKIGRDTWAKRDIYKKWSGTKEEAIAKIEMMRAAGTTEEV